MVVSGYYTWETLFTGGVTRENPCLRGERVNFAAHRDRTLNVFF